MEKEFIPYEQALVLKELGFDEPCVQAYDKNGILYHSHKTDKLFTALNSNLSTQCSAPLYQQAFRWFRENYRYDVAIKKRKFEIEKLEIYGESDPDYYFTDFPFDSYEESELKCLKKLIEIVKRKNK